ncbi:MAG: homocysteine S-methyltransferase family protein [Firmicutes bacterium]|nr:homocysteine S-methyltransferase family protein [Bacillota bacterium]
MKKLTIEDTIKKTGIMVIDGAMSTALERLGCDLNDPLWTAIVLAERPELVRRVHLDYLKAGADSGITSSYQATIPGLMKKGLTEKESEEIIARSVKIFCEARDQWWACLLEL